MFILKILYKLLLLILIPFILPIGYLIALKKGEDKDFFERLGFVTFPEPPEKCVWFHCASVGEVRSLKLVTDIIASDFPELKVIISTTTATGKAEAEKLINPYHAFLLPLENGMATAHIIGYMNVKALFFIDTELWPLFISSASKHTKLYLLNARLSERSVKSYKKYSFIFGRLLNKFEMIYAKSHADADRLASVTGHAEKIQVLGNIKFQGRKETPTPEIFSFFNSHKIFSAASTHEGEDIFIINGFKQCKSADRLVIAPRHLNRVQDIFKLASDAGLSVSLLSDKNADTQCIIVDRFGALEELYSVSDSIFIGGSLNKTGGHNIYEALQFRKTVCSGENMSNFADIAETAVKYNVLTYISDASSIASYIDSEKTGADFDGFFSEMDRAQKGLTDEIKGVLKNVYSD